MVRVAVVRVTDNVNSVFIDHKIVFFTIVLVDHKILFFTIFWINSTNHKMSDLIRPHNYRVVQKPPGGLSPRLQLQLVERFGPEGLERARLQQRENADRVRARVNAERAEAVARGVQVVVDETRSDHFSMAELSDDGTN
jgi:hypothetical protein